MSTTLTIRRPDDMHVHFRWDERLPRVLGFTARVFARALDMPNWRIHGHPWVDGDPEQWAPGVRAEDVLAHREVIQSLSPGFDPIGCLYITEQTTPEMIRAFAAAGGKACKTFFRGVSTNSGWGVRDLLSKEHFALLATMQECGLINLGHFERPESFWLEAELDALPVLKKIAEAFPELRTVIEHISSIWAVEMVEALGPNVAATITPHHLLFDSDALLKGGLKPHHYCMPLLKTPEDRRALVHAAVSGSPKFFAGTDSAPHIRMTKESACGCAGVFCAPVAMPVYAKIFEDAGALDRLEAFTSVNGANFYGLPLNEGTITLKREPWQVPESYPSPEALDGIHAANDLVPFLAGQTLDWQVEGADFS